MRWRSGTRRFTWICSAIWGLRPTKFSVTRRVWPASWATFAVRWNGASGPGDPGLALPLAAASAPLFTAFSLLVECRTWCSRAVELLELGYYGTPTEMELQAALGLVLMFTRGNSEAAEKPCSGRRTSPSR